MSNGTRGEPFRLGLVGAGRMGMTHLLALEDSRRVEIVAVVDVVSEVRANLEDRGIVAYETVAELLAAGNIDGALVAVPTTLHLDTVRELIEAHVPVLCEKPCGVSVEQARQARDLAVAHNVLLQVAYWRRFVPALQDLRERIRAGHLGDLYVVACLQWDEYPASPGFRLTSGGILKDMGVHEFDIMRWLTSQEITAAAGFASSAAVGPPVPGDPEGVQLAVQLSGGAVAAVSLGRRFPPGEVHRVQVMGTHGTEDLVYVPPGAAWEPWGPIFPALRAQAGSFADAVAGGSLLGATAEDAMAALAAAEISAESLVLSKQ